MTYPTSPGERPAPPAAQPQYGAPVLNGAQPQYGTVPPVYPPPNSGFGRTTNVLGTIAMISSIVGFFSFAVLSVAGVIMGHIALSQIKRRGEAGRGMALTGVIVGYVGIAIWGLLMLLWFFFAVGMFAIATSTSSVGTLS